MGVDFDFYDGYPFGNGSFSFDSKASSDFSGNYSYDYSDYDEMKKAAIIRTPFDIVKEVHFESSNVFGGDGRNISYSIGINNKSFLQLEWGSKGPHSGP